MANDRYRQGGRENRRGEQRSAEDVKAEVKERLQGENIPVSTGNDPNRARTATGEFEGKQQHTTLRYGGESRHEGDHVPREQISPGQISPEQSADDWQGERSSQGYQQTAETPRQSERGHQQSSWRQSNQRQSNQPKSEQPQSNPPQSKQQQTPRGQDSQLDHQRTQGSRHSLEYGAEFRHPPSHAGQPHPEEQFSKQERQSPRRERAGHSSEQIWGGSSPERRPSPQQSHQQTPPKQPHQQPDEYQQSADRQQPANRQQPGRSRRYGQRQQSTGRQSSGGQSTTDERTYSQRLEESQQLTEGQREPEEMRRKPAGASEQRGQPRRQSGTQGSGTRRHGSQQSQGRGGQSQGRGRQSQDWGQQSQGRGRQSRGGSHHSQGGNRQSQNHGRRTGNYELQGPTSQEQFRTGDQPSSREQSRSQNQRWSQNQPRSQDQHQSRGQPQSQSRDVDESGISGSDRPGQFEGRTEEFHSEGSRYSNRY